MTGTMNIYAPGGIDGVVRFNRAVDAMVKVHGDGKLRDHNATLTVPPQGIDGFHDSKANRCRVIANRCDCEPCREFRSADTVTF